MIVEDNVCSFPAIPASGRRWVRIVSCNPLEIKDPELPPPYTGLPSRRPLELGRVSPRVPERHRRDAGELQRVLRRARRTAASRGGEMIHTSDRLNLYLYPSEVDYQRSVPLGATWQNLESSVRTTDAEWAPPPELADREGALIYVSLGSLGSGDVPLMKRLVEVLAETPHRYVVSKGPQHAGVRARRQHGGGGVPAPGLGAAAGRSRDHARRQQHDHRVRCTSASRWSSCRSSGTSTTTRSGSTRRASGSDCRPTRSGTRIYRRRSTGCSPTVISPRASRTCRRGFRPRPGTSERRG